MGEMVPSLPRNLEGFASQTEALDALRSHPAYAAFLYALDELRALNYLDILNGGDQVAILTAVGEGRAFAKVARMVDDRVQEGKKLVERFDGASAQYRLRKEAERRAYTAQASAGPTRFDTG